MRFDDVKPIVEGKLYAWAEYKRSKESPLAAISVYWGRLGARSPRFLTTSLGGP